MSLPVVHIVENPTTATPKVGNFIRLTMEMRSVSILNYAVWSAQTLSILGNQPSLGDEEFKHGLRTNELIAYLVKWSDAHVMNTHLYMTESAAIVLLPEMCRPRVPFQLESGNGTLKGICLDMLGRSLYFPL